MTRAFKARLDYNWGRTWQHHGPGRFKFTMDLYRWLRWFRVIPGRKTAVHLDDRLLRTRSHAITRLIPHALRLPTVLCICHSLPRSMRSPRAPAAPVPPGPAFGPSRRTPLTIGSRKRLSENDTTAFCKGLYYYLRSSVGYMDQWRMIRRRIILRRYDLTISIGIIIAQNVVSGWKRRLLKIFFYGLFLASDFDAVR